MKLHIENFAKIKEADIEINGITVVAGENNTGKSTVGKVLFSLFDSFYNIVSKIDSQKQNNIMNIIDELGFYDEEEEEYRFLFHANRYDSNDYYETLSNSYSINDSSDEQITKIKKTLIELSDKYDSLFDEDFENAAKKIANVFSFSDDQVRKTLVLKSFNAEFNQDFYPKNKLCNADIVPKIKLKIKSQSIELTFVESSNGAVINQIHRFLPLTNKVVYIDNPSLIDSVEGGIFRYRFRQRNNHEYRTAQKLLRKNDTNIIDESILNEKIEKIKNKITDIIHGSFVLEDKKIKFQEEGFIKPHEISNLSTGVKSFALLLMLLDNGYIEPNGSIILDEPEVHLHPNWQLKYAELLVFLQQQLDLHILINSHSPYFIAAIEHYSKVYNTKEKCNYYFAELKDNFSCIENVNDNLGKIYDKLAEPFDILDEYTNGEE